MIWSLAHLIPISSFREADQRFFLIPITFGGFGTP
jgi:hypothetical protein